MKTEFFIPHYVEVLINTLEKNGFEAFIVGGCVRDLLLSKIPSDYDIATNALPEQMMQCLNEFKCIPTGLKHGTITVLSDGKSVEITTYRSDGEYLDHRRPQSVEFSANLNEDLSRRDFTVNAMAYSPKTGLIDLFGGKNDLEQKILRCVGNPQKRFDEDALRILRGLRFASTLGFDFEKETLEALFASKELLREISAERISSELLKLLCGKNAKKVLMECTEILEIVIPEIKPCIGFLQHSKYHKYDVWEHICTCVAEAKNDPIIRLAMLLHDIGKPDCFFMKDGEGHFYGHEKKSAEKAQRILKRLKFDNETLERVVLLIKSHCFNPSDDEKQIKRMLSKLGEEAFFQLLDVSRADNSAKNDFCKEILETISLCEAKAKEIIEKNECFSLKNLAVNGSDLVQMGFKGKEIGQKLDFLLQGVIDGRFENKKDILLTILQDMI